MPQYDDPAEFRPARESSMWVPVIVIVAVLVAAFGWWRWSQHREAAPEAQPSVTTPQPQTPPADVPPQPPVATGPLNPMDNLAEPEKSLPALNDADSHVTSALNDLLGRKNVTSFLQLDGFVRRAVATVDNLPREHATARVWPVLPTPQRFTVQGSGEVKTISPDNGARYTPFVLFVESIDPARAVAFYARLYPLFQEAYEELGYPNRYFNDRLVTVLDHLLKTPEPSGPVQVKITEVKGQMPLENPWTRYEFVDPQLEALSAGQKLLIRMGPVNERRMKARLSELRRLVATGTMAKK